MLMNYSKGRRLQSLKREVQHTCLTVVTRDPGFYDHVRIQRHIYLPCEVQSQLTRNLANPFQLNNGLHVFKLLKNILKIDKSYFKL